MYCSQAGRATLWQLYICINIKYKQIMYARKSSSCTIKPHQPASTLCHTTDSSHKCLSKLQLTHKLLLQTAC